MTFLIFIIIWAIISVGILIGNYSAHKGNNIENKLSLYDNDGKSKAA